MRRPHLTLFATLLSGLTCCAVSAQRPSPTARLQSARALYYNPAAAGLESFSCRVQPDWKAILTQATHAPVTDDNLFLVHLNSVQISTIDRLSGLGELHWHNTATPDEKFAASANEMQLSVSQMFQGIYQSWNAYLDGSMFPYGDTTATSDAAGGVHVKYVQSKMATEEIYDKNMLLTEARFATDGLAVIAIPTFTDTPDGPIISSVTSELRQPPSAAPMHTVLSATYQTVDKYRIPASFHFEIKNVASFDFALNECTVNGPETTIEPAARPDTT